MIQEIFTIPFTDIKISTSQTQIELWGLVTNIIVGSLAFIVLLYTKKQTTIAKNALKETVEANKFAIDWQQKLAIDAKRESEEKEIIERARLDLENSPFLQIQDFEIKHHNNVIEGLRYKIHNLGKYPIKIEADRFNILVDFEDEEMNIPTDTKKHFEALGKRRFNMVGQYVTSDNPVLVTQKGSFDTNGLNYFPAVAASSMIYTTGEVLYKNLYNNKNMIYKYVIFTYFLGDTKYKFFENSNQELPNPFIP